MGKMIGIDLGTTNSCVAVMEGDKPTVIVNSDGERTTPSVIAFTREGERLVGAAARRQAAMNPERTISSIKRDMGSDRRVKIDGRSYSPQELSAMILGKLKKDAEAYLGTSVSDAVITVPAYFTDAQRQATKDAGTIAGLNVQRIVNEPTAAALSYGVDREEDKAVMVYDLGGGTFDVSILEISGGIIEVKATAGNNHLGGDDFDDRLVDYLVKEFKKTQRADLSKDAAAMQRIREACEQAKKELSAAQQTTINLPFISTKGSEPLHLNQEVTRAKFDALTADLVESTMGPARQALADAGLSANELGKVLLVGGSTRIPAVRDAVKKLTDKEPSHNINPDESVALGACLQAGVLGGVIGGLVLLDVTPLSLGVELKGDVMATLIARNSTIPITHAEVYTTASAMQTQVEINVLQGERKRASENKSLGKFRLGGIKRGFVSQPQIEVTFALDANGIVHVTAKDLGTGNSADITIEGSSNLSQAEIERARADAAAHAAEDAAFEKEQKVVNDAESLCNQAEQVIASRGKDDKEGKRYLEGLVKQLRHAVKKKDKPEIERLSEELERAIANSGS
jgi:molecular chaperone DnaK